MRFIHAVLVLLVAGLLGFASHAAAQQVTVSTPFRSNNDSFFERMGTNWGFSKGNMFFSFGGPNMAVPQFGGFDPSAGIHSGIYHQRGDFSGYFNFAAGHGFRQSLTTQVPSVTMMNGQTASISDRSITPFVMGFIPIVGDYPTTGYSGYSDYSGYSGPIMPLPGYAIGDPGMGGQVVSPLVGNPQVRDLIENMQPRRRGPSGELPEPPAVAPIEQPQPRAEAAGGARHNDLDLDMAAGAPDAAAAADGDSPGPVASVRSSSAGRAVPSVAEARRLYEAEQATESGEAQVLFERGRAAQAEGKLGAARVYYQMVARSASGSLREQAEARLHSLNSPGIQ